MLPHFVLYFIAMTVPLLSFFLIGQGPVAIAIAAAVTFVLHPFADSLIRLLPKSLVAPQGRVEPEQMGRYFLPVYLCLPVQMALMVYAYLHGTESFVQACVSGILCGMAGGIQGVTCAHELIHSRKPFERLYGKSLLFLVNYPHFAIEHFWHHLKLATPEDVDTAKKGQSLYSFLVHAIPLGWMVCWKWEAIKTRKKNFPVVSIHNAMIRLFAIQVLIHVAIFYAFGGLALLAFAVQGLVSMVLLKWVNYVEHYGLKRKMKNGKWEAVSSAHSWDTDYSLSNWTLFNLGYHSLHHQAPSISFPNLPHLQKDKNLLPSGYTVMMVLALAPPLWVRTLDPIIEKREKNLLLSPCLS